LDEPGIQSRQTETLVSGEGVIFISENFERFEFGIRKNV